jgi:hypothetical protein
LRGRSEQGDDRDAAPPLSALYVVTSAFRRTKKSATDDVQSTPSALFTTASQARQRSRGGDPFSLARACGTAGEPRAANRELLEVVPGVDGIDLVAG